MKKFLLFLLFYLPINVFAQENVGFLQLYVYPDQCKISINDTLFVKSKSKISLPQGTHKINISAPKLKSVSQVITIQKDSTTIYRKILGYNDTYLAYKNDLREYSLKKGAIVTSTAILVGLTLYLTYNFTIQSAHRQKEAYDKTMYYKDLYLSSFNPTDLASNRNSFNKYKDEYYKFRREKYYVLPIAIVGGFLTYKTYKYAKSIKKPRYIEPLSFNYNMFNNQFYLSYEF
jgi:hypothetical protein